MCLVKEIIEGLRHDKILETSPTNLIEELLEAGSGLFLEQLNSTTPMLAVRLRSIPR